MTKKAGLRGTILALLALASTQAKADDDISGMRPTDGSCCQCKTCFCFNCQCDRPITTCEDSSCWFHGLPVKRDHQHQPRCCTPRPPEIPFDPCPTRPRPLPLPGPSTPWPWLDPRAMSNAGN